MTMLNLARSGAAVVEAAAGIETRSTPTRSAIVRRGAPSLLAALLMAAGATVALPASANDAPVGPLSFGSSSSGRMIIATSMGARHTQSVTSLSRSHSGREEFEAREDFERAREFRRFHHRDRDRFADAFFPFGFFPGFGWFDQPELAAAPRDDQADWRSLPFWVRLDRYAPPTVETTPSGVTIIRGPGSHHGFLRP